MIIGMTTSIAWFYSNAHSEVLAAGARTLIIEDPLEVLRRMFPCGEAKQRTINGTDLLNKGKL